MECSRRLPWGRTGCVGDTEENVLRRELQSYPSHQSELDVYLQRSGASVETKLLEQLQKEKAHEPEFFHHDVRNANFLAYLLFRQQGRFQEAQSENDAVLDKSPHNILALCLRAHLMLVDGNIRGCGKTVGELKQLQKDSDGFKQLMNQAESEICFCLFILGPTYSKNVYRKLCELLSTVLPKIEMNNGMIAAEDASLASSLTPHQVVLWCNDLAKVSNRLVSGGNMDPEEWDAFDVDDHFRRVRAATLFVKHNSDLFAGRALVELANAYVRYKITHQWKAKPEKLPSALQDENRCFDLAKEISPGDPYVLEKFGAHVRKQATNIAAFKGAVSILDEALRINPSRHVCFHQKGLAYKAMSEISGRLPEAYVHTNNVKKGKGKRKKYIQKTTANLSSKSQETSKVECSLLGEPQDHNCNSLINDTRYEEENPESGYYSIQSSGGSAACNTDNASENSTHIRNVDDSNVSPKVKHDGKKSFEGSLAEEEMQSSKGRPYKNCLIKSHHPVVQGATLKKQSRRDYFSYLKSLNTVIPEHMPEAIKFRKYALESFEEASRLVQSTSCRYLMDIGRSYICLGDPDSALAAFRAANDSKIQRNSADEAELFEQWGELLWSGMCTSECSREQIEEMYRKAVHCGVISRQGSSVAFSKLCLMIEEDLAKNPNSVILKAEHALLFKTVMEHKKAINAYRSLLLSQSVDDRDVIFHLSDLLNKEGDYVAAYLYISCQLWLGDFSNWCPRYKDQAVDVLCNAASIDTPYLKRRDLYKTAITKMLPISDCDPGNNRYDVSFLASAENSNTTKFVQDAIVDHCKLEMCHLYTGDSSARSDITGGESYFGVAEKAMKTHLFIINVDDLADSILSKIAESISLRFKGHKVCVTGNPELNTVPLFLEGHLLVHLKSFMDRDYSVFMREIVSSLVNKPTLM